MERQRDDWHAKQIIVNYWGASGVSETIPLEDYYTDMQTEKKFYTLKRMAERERLVSSRNSFLHRSSEGNGKHAGLKASDPLTESLHKSRGKPVLARHVIREVRQYTTPRNNKLLSKEIRQSRQFTGRSITKKETIHLFRIVESSSQLTFLRYYDVSRRDWFLSRCCHTWGTSNHRVLGTSLSDKGASSLEKTNGVEFYPYSKSRSLIHLTVSWNRVSAPINAFEVNPCLR